MLLVIGAGPYGIAVAARALESGIETVVLGRPFAFWSENMPDGMYLRSGPDWHLDASRIHTFESFLEERGVEAAEIDPVPIAVFLDYARWFQREKGVVADERFVTSVRLEGSAGKRPEASSFQVHLDDGSVLGADAIVAAPGVRYFQNRPDWSTRLPNGLCAHTCDLVRFHDLSGARVLIVGGRQSAYEWAALIGEQGAEQIDIVHRHEVPRFARVSWRFADEYLERTVAFPGWWRSLPAQEQEAITRKFWEVGRLTLEWWLTPRLQGERFRRRPGTSVVAAWADGDERARVQLSDGTELAVDRIVLATGYKADLAGVPYLSEVLPLVAVADGFPLLDDAFQTTLPGLFMPGFTGSRDFGPFFGFTKGCPAAADLVVRGLSRR